MPEGPEIHMAARYINQVAKHHKFGGKIVKSEVSTKNPTVDFSASLYNIHAESRGKELKVFLADSENTKSKTHILFRFGMSGSFKLTSTEDLPKHAHLRFFTVAEEPQQVLSFVDYRRFGRWEIEADWGENRGPDPMFDYENFRQNILSNLSAAAFNRPICETMLDQKYFNGIGNYLRAEILFRARIQPFTQAREVLESVEQSSKERDIILLCHTVSLEVLNLDKGKNYDPQGSDQSFSSWLQCYTVEGMNHISDSHGRTVWFAGKPGPMVPKNSRVVGRKGGARNKIPKSGNNPPGKASTSDEDHPKSLGKTEQKFKTEDEDESKSKRPKRIPKSGKNAPGKVSTSDEDHPKSLGKTDKKSKTDQKPKTDEDEDVSKSKRPKRTRRKT